MTATMSPKSKSHTYRVGGISPHVTLLRRMRFPVLADLESVTWLERTLRDVVESRMGALVVGRKGRGKSLGLERAIRTFRRAEEQLARGDKSYQPREVVTLPPIAAETRAELIRAVYSHVFGGVSMRASRAGDAAMLKEIVEAWRDLHIAAVCFDEADQLSAKALGVARDIVAISHALAGDLDDQDETHAAGGRGIGVLLLGTPSLEDRLARTEEHGERWAYVVTLEGVAAEELAGVYAAYLPAFAAEAERRGEAEWAALIATRVAPHIGGSLRRVATHVRTYVTMWNDEAPARPNGRPAGSLEEVGFDEAYFLDSLQKLAKAAGPGAAEAA